MVFYEQVRVRKRTLKEIAANCNSRIQRMRSWQTQKHTNLVNGAYFMPFIFETVRLLIWWNVFIRLMTHRLTSLFVMFHGTRLLFHFHDTWNQHNHGLTNEIFCKSHNATVGGRHLQDSQRIQIQNGRNLPLQAV